MARAWVRCPERSPDERPTGELACGPPSCPYGHVLGPNRVLISWVRCSCAEAQAASGTHSTWTCLTCLDTYRITTVCYQPAHLGGGHPSAGH